MAHQAILAAHARRRKEAEADKDGLGGREAPSLAIEQETKAKVMELRQALKAKSADMYRLFQIWDEDGDGSIDDKEFVRAMKMLGLHISSEDFDDFCRVCRVGTEAGISLEEITDIIESTPEPAKTSESAESSNLLLRLFKMVYWVIGTVGGQSALYFVFVLIFNSLTSTLRLREEYYLDKMFSDTFIENIFDEQHNRFEQIRRVADVWEWGNTVLWPGLLGNSGPACGELGTTGAFNSAVEAAGSVNADAGLAGGVGGVKGGCNEHAWPDGSGTFHHGGSTSFTVAELVARFNEMDWTEGVVIWQSRVNAQPSTFCKTRTIGGLCYPAVTDEAMLLATGSSVDLENRTAFGHNWTHPTSPLSHPFRYFEPVESGGVPTGPTSAHPASLQRYPAGGFLAIVIPFFSDTYLPDQKGPSDQIIDFTPHRVTASSGGVARYFCVRLVWNGDFIHQLCDGNDPATGRTTGVVRASIEEFWNDMKRAHFVDSATRAVTITLPLSSHNAGVRARATVMFEFTLSGAVLPSYDSQTRVTRADLLEMTATYCWTAFAFVIFFAALEFIEVISDGPLQYFGNMWNVMDCRPRSGSNPARASSPSSLVANLVFSIPRVDVL